MAVYSLYTISFLIYLVMLSYNDGSVSMDNQKEISKIKRFKRYNNCPVSTADSENGYLPLKKEKVEVEFLLIDQNHVARVKWKIPAVNKVPIGAFSIIWNGYNTKCELVSNQTSTYDIRPSSNIWRYDQNLYITIFPIPMKKGSYISGMLSFTPDYKVLVKTTAAQNGTGQITTYVESTTSTWSSTDHRTSNDNSSIVDDHDPRDDYSAKLIIGSVIGVAMAIVIIILVYCKKFPPTPPVPEDIYYISYYPESDKFVKEVKKFADWLSAYGFKIQMVTDEEDMLSEYNRKLRRELMEFKFRDHMIKTTDKVFIIFSPTYLLLCQMKEEDAVNRNYTQDDRRVNEEIVQIRCELYENMYRSDRFIPILFRKSNDDVPFAKADVPFWIKELVYYSWPEDKTNNRLLNGLNDLPECSPNNLA